MDNNNNYNIEYNRERVSSGWRNGIEYNVIDKERLKLNRLMYSNHHLYFSYPKQHDMRFVLIFFLCKLINRNKYFICYGYRSTQHLTKIYVNMSLRRIQSTVMMLVIILFFFFLCSFGSIIIILMNYFFFCF